MIACSSESFTYMKVMMLWDYGNLLTIVYFKRLKSQQDYHMPKICRSYNNRQVPSPFLYITL